MCKSREEKFFKDLVKEEEEEEEEEDEEEEEEEDEEVNVQEILELLMHIIDEDSATYVEALENAIHLIHTAATENINLLDISGSHDGMNLTGIEAVVYHVILVHAAMLLSATTFTNQNN